MLWTKAPFCAACRTVGLDGGAVDGDIARPDPGVAGQSLENPTPYALTAPTIEAVVDSRVGAVLGRTVAPARARLQHMHDPADHPVVVYPTGPATPTRQMRFDPSPSLVIKPIKFAHPRLPFKNLESNRNSKRQPN